MPAYCKCPICGFDGPHGFNPTLGALMLYHTAPHGNCVRWEGAKGVYRTALEHFRAEVLPTCVNAESRVWAQARIADLSGHPRKAKKLYAEWQRLCLK